MPMWVGDITFNVIFVIFIFKSSTNIGAHGLNENIYEARPLSSFFLGEVSFSAVDALDAEDESAWQENHQEKD